MPKKKETRMFLDHELYKEDIDGIASSGISWDKLKNKHILITGASGLIGTFLIDALMYRNSAYSGNITIYAVGRNKEKALARFKPYFDSPNFMFIQADIQKPLEAGAVDYIIHGASNTHPVSYAADPVNTVLLSVLGTKNALDFAAVHDIKRTLFLSTVEVYGENRGDVDTFTEDYCGYIDCNTLRAGYTEGKRAAEALCQAYIKEKGADIVIARYCRVYGPTMAADDSKVIAQFIRNAVNGGNIALKSRGHQQYSYGYAADVCRALLVLLLNGRNGEAYNVCGPAERLSLAEIAGILAEYAGTNVIFDVPSATEAAGYSKAEKALLDNAKLRRFGFEPAYPLRDGLIRTIDILKNAAGKPGKLL